MFTKPMLLLLLSLCASTVIAQEKNPSSAAPDGHKPPPQAYADCKGKKSGDSVQHTTPEGKVAATCVESPEGLVARPNDPPKHREKVSPKSGDSNKGESQDHKN